MIHKHVLVQLWPLTYVKFLNFDVAYWWAFGFIQGYYAKLYFCIFSNLVPFLEVENFTIFWLHQVCLVTPLLFALSCKRNYFWCSIRVNALKCANFLVKLPKGDHSEYGFQEFMVELRLQLKVPDLFLFLILVERGNILFVCIWEISIGEPYGTRKSRIYAAESLSISRLRLDYLRGRLAHLWDLSLACFTNLNDLCFLFTAAFSSHSTAHQLILIIWQDRRWSYAGV